MFVRPLDNERLDDCLKSSDHNEFSTRSWENSSPLCFRLFSWLLKLISTDACLSKLCKNKLMRSCLNGKLNRAEEMIIKKWSSLQNLRPFVSIVSPVCKKTKNCQILKTYAIRKICSSGFVKFFGLLSNKKAVSKIHLVKMLSLK